MKITKLEVTEPAHLRSLQMSRCEHKLRRYVTEDRKYQCRRNANYEVEGVKLCKMHAGEACLTNALENADQ